MHVRENPGYACGQIVGTAPRPLDGQYRPVCHGLYAAVRCVCVNQKFDVCGLSALDGGASNSLQVDCHAVVFVHFAV